MTAADQTPEAPSPHRNPPCLHRTRPDRGFLRRTQSTQICAYHGLQQHPQSAAQVRRIFRGKLARRVSLLAFPGD